MEPVFYSQNGEDRWITNNLDLPAKGYYVDVGAGHPTETSNTAFLRDRGWTGLAIDGNRHWIGAWEGIPGFVCAVIALTPQATFWENLWWSRINSGNQFRDAETIEHLLGRFEVGKIDFLSVDTEGTELEVLHSFDFDLHQPAVVIAEYNALHLPIVAPDQSPIPALMAEKGYTLRHVIEPVNMIFTK